MTTIEWVNLEDYPLNATEILRALSSNEVDFIVVGGVAATLQGSALGTVDFDATIRQDEQNRARLAEALEELGARLMVEYDMADERGLVVDQPIDSVTIRDIRPLRLMTKFGVVDIVDEAAAVGGYDGWAPRMDRMGVAGMTVQVASVEDLIRSKEALARPKDKRALPFLYEVLRQRRGD